MRAPVIYALFCAAVFTVFVYTKVEGMVPFGYGVTPIPGSGSGGGHGGGGYLGSHK